MKREGRQGWKGRGGGGGRDTGCRLSVRLSSESSDCSLEFAATCLSATRPPWPGPRRPPSWAVGFRSRACLVCQPWRASLLLRLLWASSFPGWAVSVFPLPCSSKLGADISGSSLQSLGAFL